MPDMNVNLTEGVGSFMTLMDTAKVQVGGRIENADIIVDSQFIGQIEVVKFYQLLRQTH